MTIESITNTIPDIVTESPSDIIIREIKGLLNSGKLKPGDRLPAERKLAEKFGIGRAYVRDAIKKLEFYGVLKTLPQSGSVIAGLEIPALEGLITDVLKLDNYDFYSLVETRLILETNAARLCALRRTNEDIKKIEIALQNYLDKSNLGGMEVTDADLTFHRCIAEGSKNMVIKSLMMIITPDILKSFNEYKVCQAVETVAANEHLKLLEYIRAKDSEAAEATMRLHLNNVMVFAATLKNK
jgi:GntR family transcriptional regulator, transcriptional repressor for pyruvate dehydrogenase complex